MDSPEHEIIDQDLDAMIQTVVDEWKKLPLDIRNEKAAIEKNLDDSNIALDGEGWSDFEERLNVVLLKEGYTGAPLTAHTEILRGLRSACDELATLYATEVAEAFLRGDEKAN